MIFRYSKFWPRFFKSGQISARFSSFRRPYFEEAESLQPVQKPRRPKFSAVDDDDENGRERLIFHKPRPLENRLQYLSKKLKIEEDTMSLIKPYNKQVPEYYDKTEESKAEIKNLMNQLRRDIVDDFYGACKALSICIYEFEHMQFFVDQCLKNWFLSIEPFLDNKKASSAVVSGVIFNLSRLNKATSGDIHIKLGWDKMEKLSFYCFDNTETMNAINYKRLIDGLYQYQRTWKYGKLPGHFSPDFLPKVAQSTIWYCWAVEHFSKTDDLVKFDFLNTLFKIFSLGENQPLPEETKEFVVKFVIDEFKMQTGSDKNYSLHVVLNYLCKIDTIFEWCNLKIEDYNLDFDFWKRWIRRVMQNTRLHHDEQLLFNNFSALLMKRVLIRSYERNLEQTFLQYKTIWIEYMKNSVKFFNQSKNNVHDMIEIVQSKNYSSDQTAEINMQNELLAFFEQFLVTY